MHDFIPNAEESSKEYETNMEHSFEYTIEDVDYSSDEEIIEEIEGFESIKPHRIRFRRDAEVGFDIEEDEMDVLREITEYDRPEFEDYYSASSDAEYHYEPEWEID